jgi:putative transposase
VRHVSRNGGIRWHNHWVNVSHVLGDEYIAFGEIDDGIWLLFLGPVLLGKIDEATMKVYG